jgi:hypothetical protein
MRHTFISRLAENPNVSEQTVRALAGHVSRQMLERHSHIRSQAKQAAIQALEHGAVEPNLQATGHKIGHAETNTSGAGIGKVAENKWWARQDSNLGPTDYEFKKK